MIKTSRMLDYAKLVSHGPCETSLDRFSERFQNSVEVTVELAVSQADDWDWYWAGRELLEDYQSFIEAIKDAETAYNSAIIPFSDLNSKAWERAFDESRRIREEMVAKGTTRWEVAKATYKNEHEVTKVSNAALVAANGVARKDLNKEMARVFAELYIAEGEQG